MALAIQLEKIYHEEANVNAWEFRHEKKKKEREIKFRKLKLNSCL